MKLLMTATVLAALLCAGCPDESEPEAVSEVGEDAMDESETLPPADVATQDADDELITIESPAFDDGAAIPVKYTADGENISPPLEISGVPEGAAALALVMHDPDAPMEGGFTHWVVYGMPPVLTEIPEGIPAEPRVEDPALVQGTNSAGEIGYTGPAPPEGDEAHRYDFRLYALSQELDVEPGAAEAELAEAMKGKIVAQGTVTGTYDR
jgi:hypothetical protein